MRAHQVYQNSLIFNHQAENHPFDIKLFSFKIKHDFKWATVKHYTNHTTVHVLNNRLPPVIYIVLNVMNSMMLLRQSQIQRQLK